MPHLDVMSPINRLSAYIMNIIKKKTFEEYIFWRLPETLLLSFQPNINFRYIFCNNLNWQKASILTFKQQKKSNKNQVKKK